MLIEDLQLFFSPQLGQNGVFETLHAYHGKVFQKQAHIDRLFASCKTTGIHLKVTQDQLSDQLDQALAKSELQNAIVRITVQNLSEDDVRLNIMTKVPKKYPKSLYSKGVKLRTTVVTRHATNSQTPQVKTSNYLNGVLVKCDIQSPEIFECIHLNQKGFITECTTSNIFMIKNNELLTPSKSQGILPGVTRNLVLSLAKDLSIKTQETVLMRHDLYNANEVFITNTGFEIMPVIEIDGRVIGNEKVGKLTKKLIKEFEGLR